MTDRRPYTAEDMALCRESTAAFGRTFMPKLFFRDLHPGHYRLMNAIDNPNIRNINAICFRGFGKTSSVRAGQVKRSIFKQSRYFLNISYTDKKAMKDTESVRRVFENNRLIQAQFGNLVGSPWSKEGFSTASGDYWEPRGNGEQVRGSLYDEFRPDFALLDDLEDPRRIKNDAYREKTRKYLASEIIPLFDQGEDAPESKLVVLGTPTHQDCLGERLRKDPSFYQVRVPLCDSQLRSCWPQYKSDAGVRAFSDTFRSIGMWSQFVQEYMLEAMDEELAVFKEEYWEKNRYDETDPSFKAIEGELRNVILVDPARKADSNKTAKTAIIGYGYHPQTGRFYIRRIKDERYSPKQMIDETDRMARDIKARHIGIEVTGLHDHIVQPFKDFMGQARANYKFKELNAPNNMSKDEKIEGLLPYYERGAIYHNKQCCSVLELQLKAHPVSQYKDVMDCVSTLVLMQKKLGWNFRPIQLPRPAGVYGPGHTSYDAPSPTMQRIRNELTQADWNVC